MKIQSISRLRRIAGRRFLVRVDFNVPFEDGNIKDDYRIRQGARTISYLIDNGARVIVMSHLGDPAGYDSDFSCLPLAKRLSKILKKKVSFVAGPLNGDALEASLEMSDGDVLMIDNLRFNKGEKSNSKAFAKQLASLGDIYINDAFSVSHRRQASVAAVSSLLPAYAGLLMADEIENLSLGFSPNKPMVVVMGGAKISTKAPMISKLKPKADHILLGGLLSNTFLAHLGYEIGKSIYDKDGKSYVSKFVSKKKLDKKIVLPKDLAVLDRSGHACSRKVDEVKKTDRIFDIGPETAMEYSRLVSGAKTIIWNGPLGKFEEPAFKYGTLAVASAIAARSKGRAFGIVGGGETIESLKLTKMEKYVDFISTGGGAMLAFLGKEPMPGLDNIIR